jgi:hypothetical protein
VTGEVQGPGNAISEAPITIKHLSSGQRLSEEQQALVDEYVAVLRARHPTGESLSQEQRAWVEAYRAYVNEEIRQTHARNVCEVVREGLARRGETFDDAREGRSKLALIKMLASCRNDTESEFLRAIVTFLRLAILSLALVKPHLRKKLVELWGSMSESQSDTDTEPTF